METREIRKKLRRFILRDLVNDPEYPLEDDEGIITGGLIDSFALVQVQMFIDETFGVWIDDTEMTVENMDTLADMVSRIEANQP